LWCSDLIVFFFLLQQKPIHMQILEWTLIQ
jgi:hypothetical protein